MALFQNSVLKKYLKALDIEAVKAAYEQFTACFHNPEIQQNIRDAKEEQFQEGFLRELFVKILDYTLNPQPNYNLTTELKNEKDSKKADGAILQDGKALAVIELKGTDTTDLDKINAQAFNYKNNHSHCIYVVTSNFEKLRFFIHNAVEHIEFNLFTLTEDEFQVLWLCLQVDSLFNGIPLKAKEDSLLEEEKVTKNLYKDYSEFKIALWQNMVINHPDDDKLMLYKKTQKLLDRFLFIFFAEDKGLLPPNSISKIVAQWEKLKELDEYRPLYERFKKYFGYLNTGWKGKEYEIFAYNGGLFALDKVLDANEPLQPFIDDEVLHPHVIKLTGYDFESEVDVNILGHIFEHSLSEIENITARLEGREVEKSKTKRKKDGVYYTPKYITKYIVENTLGRLCEEKKKELEVSDEIYGNAKIRSRKRLKNLEDYRNWLLGLKICDPACGSGAFLNQALEYLINEHRYLDELTARYHGASLVLSDIENDILENNLFGVDINEESVEIAKLSLWLRTAQRGRKLTSLSNNLKCGNSLIDDPEVAGEKAFNWQKEFPDIFPEKEKKAWHITCATHNSRYSQRMFDNHVKPGTPVWLSEKEEQIVTETIAGIAEKDELNILAYNICGDHMHLMLVCEKDKLSQIVQKIKSMSARACNIATGRTTPSRTREHAPLPSEHAPLPSESSNHSSRGPTQTHLWTQKYGCKEITSKQQLYNTIEYIQNNRKKHELPEHTTKGVSSHAEKICCSTGHAFRAEYKGGFDVVIGNPPYVDIKGLDEIIVDYLFENYKSANNRINLYSSFIEKSIYILKEAGCFSFIIPSSILTQDSYKKLREIILSKSAIKNIIRLPNESFGGSAGEVKVDTIILSFQIGQEKRNFVEVMVYKGFERINEISEFNADLYFHTDINSWKEDENHIFRINVSDSISLVIKKCQNGTIPLIECSDFSLGLTPYDKYKGHTPDQITNRIFHSSYKKDESFKKLLAGNDVTRYSVTWNGNDWISYGDWLGAPREKRFFQEKRILVKQIIDWTAKRIWAALTNEEFYNTQNAFNIITKEGFEVEFLIAILNSRLMSFFHRKKFLEEYKDRFQKILIRDCKQFPIKNIDINFQKPFVDLVESIIKQTSILKENQYQFVELLQSKFDIEKLSKKLQNWHELDFKEFLRELKKAKVQLSLSEEAEWMQYFNERKQKTQELKAEIDRVDKEIDNMVYELYGLTEEEIEIVEGA